MKNILFLSLLLLTFSCEMDMSSPSSSSNTIGNGVSSNFQTAAYSTNIKGVKVNRQVLEDYINLFKELKATSADGIELINELDPEAENHPQFGTLTSIMEKYGLTYEDFVKLNAKIGVIYGVLQFNMQNLQAQSDQTVGQMDEMAKEIQAMIDDPDVPEEKKAELREALKQTEKGGRDLNNMWENNKEKAQNMIKRSRKRLKKIATAEEIQLVRGYNAPLKELYNEIAQPTIEDSI
jgi:hypothetical protein